MLLPLVQCVTRCPLLIHPELSLITLHWFLTSFASVVDIRLLLRIWDLLFYQGSLVLFQVTLGMLKIQVFILHYLSYHSAILSLFYLHSCSVSC